MTQQPDKPDAADPAMTLRLGIEDQWCRVADPERWPGVMGASLLIFACSTIALGASEAAAPPRGVLAPAQVLGLADTYIASSPQQEDVAWTRRTYLGSFFMGYVNPGGSLSTEDPASRAGFEAGQQYRHSKPTELKETMEGFGYTATNAQGKWLVFFEHSIFRTPGDSGRGWWLTALPHPESAQAIAPDVPEQGGPVRISGFLSPKGRYGHLGMCDYQFFATNISLLQVGQPDGAGKEGQRVRAETNRTSPAAASRR